MDLSLQVGKYDIQKLLGKGATGTVYLAKDKFTGKEVALKTIEPEVFRDPEFGTVYRSQFLNEASLAGKLRHPHIVGILDAVVTEDSGHIAMELVTGGDLSQHVTPGHAAAGGRRAADRLQVLRRARLRVRKQGIVHRDIKPANIMIAKGTDMKIADFGAAFLKKSQVGADRGDGLAVLHVARADRGQDAHLPQRHVLARRGAVRAAHRPRPFIAENLDAADQQDPHRRAGAAERGCARACRRRSTRWCCARWQEGPGAALRHLGRVRARAVQGGELVLPPGRSPTARSTCAEEGRRCSQLLADAELWELARAGKLVARAEGQRGACRENEPGASFFFLAKGEAKVTRAGKLLNMVNEGECFGEMAYIRGGEQPRHATVEAMSELMLAEFEPEALEKMSLGAQLHLTRALVRNVTDRLALANTRIAR